MGVRRCALPREIGAAPVFASVFTRLPVRNLLRQMRLNEQEGETDVTEWAS